MLLSVGVVAMCVGLAAGVIGVVLPRVGSRTPLGVYLRYAAVAGALSVGSGLMYIVSFNGGAPGALVVADTAMVLAPATLCVAVWPPSGARYGSPVMLGAAIVIGGVMAVCSTVLTPATSMKVKVALLTVVCGACAVIALRNRALPPRSTRLLGAVQGAYSVYSALRSVVHSTPESPLSQSLFSITGAGVVSVTSMLLCGVAIGLVGRPAARTEHSGSSHRTLVTIGDWKLATAAFGRDRVRGLLIELRLAAQDLDPTAVDAPHGVEVAIPSAASALRERMRSTYGWRPEETGLLIDGSSAPRSRRRTGA
ncbi:MAG: glycerol uptake facilitator [Microbacterium sp.]|jgi:hypothetical protein|uniref:hypothetical protein n=1 Tax=Microbacterium sp. Kw_RZR3 TaxID=3032903 RepID=UPI0023DC09C4|nr:hypothetical protein [Microbacterium sp. Kw_RZR3]MDF2045817.1 hypothetical protein [Microbacterium sp. Kw_RZR3]MDF2918423.1 glycerol uptake facilitator [Microbacterium sp.]